MPARPSLPAAGSKSAAEQLVSPAAVQQRQNSSGISDFELPKTTLTKLAKGSIPDNVKMQQDVVQALIRSSTVFISYLSAAAHDQALDRSGKSITAADVLKAITDLDFGPADALIPLLEQELAGFRANVLKQKANKAKANAISNANRNRRKSGADQSGDVEMGDGDDDDEGEEGEDGEEGEGDEGEGEAEDEDEVEEGMGEEDEVEAEA